MDDQTTISFMAMYMYIASSRYPIGPFSTKECVNKAREIYDLAGDDSDDEDDFHGEPIKV